MNATIDLVTLGCIDGYFFVQLLRVSSSSRNFRYHAGSALNIAADSIFLTFLYLYIRRLEEKQILGW
jgi:hypothetical protein